MTTSTSSQHRERALSSDRPILRGTAQNPDVFFQAREACNPYYTAAPTIVQDVMDRFANADRPHLSTCSIISAQPMPSASSSSWAPAQKLQKKQLKTSSRKAKKSAC